MSSKCFNECLESFLGVFKNFSKFFNYFKAKVFENAQTWPKACLNKKSVQPFLSNQRWPTDKTNSVKDFYIRAN